MSLYKIILTYKKNERIILDKCPYSLLSEIIDSIKNNGIYWNNLQDSDYALWINPEDLLLVEFKKINFNDECDESKDEEKHEISDSTQRENK